MLDPPGGTASGPVTVTLSGADEAGGSGLDKLDVSNDGVVWIEQCEAPPVDSCCGISNPALLFDGCANIVLIDTYDRLRREGMPVEEAILRTCR